MDEQSLSQYLADSPPSVVQLAARPHFEALSEKQKLYAHHISRAAFQGTRIMLRQVSPEAETIFDLILALHRACGGDWAQLQRQTGVADADVRHFLEYATQFLGNVGNYKGFGDSKFIPRLSPAAFERLASASPETKEVFERAAGAMYADFTKPGLMHLGFPDKGHLSNYYPDSPEIAQDEIERVNAFLADKGLLPENSRLRKLVSGDFEVLIASGVDNPLKADVDTADGAIEFELGSILERATFQGKKVRLVFGDHKEEMAKIALHMKQAGLQAANERQKAMMDGYAKSFGTGSLRAFKECQKLWVQDVGPVVESNIGFVESYRDPAGVRAEWEGFAAIVNQERTKAFGQLVARAPALVPTLPWPAAFEKDAFQAPDFTSLEVLAFASTGIPAGINIPNYDDIRQQVGFKNVSLGNVLAASAPNEPIPFLHPDDLEFYRAHRDLAFEVQVGIHELLGHGTGKLLQETSAGTYNFDHAHPPVSPVTGASVTTYYRPGQTWSSVFGSIASSYEECRAECVAMVLACEAALLELFGCGPPGADGTVDLDGKPGDVLHAAYLSMARAGLAALEFWDPTSKKWGQAHMQARFSILQVLLQAGEGLVTLLPPGVEKGAGNADELCVRVDRRKIAAVGRPAMEAYLQKLHVYKASADVAAGTALYEDATRVEGWWANEARMAVMKKRPPRKVFVQANTVEEGGKVVLKEYEPTMEGMIQSFAERGV